MHKEKYTLDNDYLIKLYYAAFINSSPVLLLVDKLLGNFTSK